MAGPALLLYQNPHVFHNDLKRREFCSQDHYGTRAMADAPWKKGATEALTAESRGSG